MHIHIILEFLMNYKLCYSTHTIHSGMHISGSFINYVANCDDLYTGDVVYVDGYDSDFKVTTYENDMPKYIPYI